MILDLEADLIWDARKETFENNLKACKGLQTGPFVPHHEGLKKCQTWPNPNGVFEIMDANVCSGGVASRSYSASHPPGTLSFD